MAVSLNHQPVLLHEAVDALAIRPDGIYVDGTFGRGGHSSLILQQLGSSGRLVALDRDPDAIRSAAAVIGGDPRFSIEHVSFDALEEVSVKLGIKGEVDGVLRQCAPHVTGVHGVRTIHEAQVRVVGDLTQLVLDTRHVA